MILSKKNKNKLNEYPAGNKIFSFVSEIGYLFGNAIFNFVCVMYLRVKYFNFLLVIILNTYL